MVPPIAPFNPRRLDANRTVWDGDATGGATETANTWIDKSWASMMDEASDLEGSVHQGDDGPSEECVFPEAVGPDIPVPRDPLATDQEQMNRDHDSWRESLRQELILTQGYYVGWDSLEFLDFRPGQLSREHKEMIDREYVEWIKLELGSAHTRKGHRRRARRREAADREEATGPAAPMSKKKRRRADYVRVQKSHRRQPAYKLLVRKYISTMGGLSVNGATVPARSATRVAGDTVPGP